MVLSDKIENYSLYCSVLDKYQESLLPLEATEMPALAETTSPTPLNPEDEGANFDDMSRIIQVGLRRLKQHQSFC